jgi:hypothetical protein
MSIAVAESKKKNTPKTLSHLEIHPQLGGGHVVKHVYSGYQHDPKEVKFNEKGVAKGGEHIAAHLAKHAGLPGYDKRQESETEQEIED